MTTNLKLTQTQELYQRDYYQWLNTTAQLLRDRRYDDVNFDNLIEEIEAMGSSERRELENRLRVLLMHLLKYKYQPNRRSNSWLNTIDEQRNQLELLLEYSPSLKPFYFEVFDKCYLKARRSAAKETGLSINTFPDLSPFTQEDTLDPDWLPQEE